MAKRLRALTGIQPSGIPHIGNLKGMIEPALALQETHDPFYFIASYHAMTTTKDPALLRKYQREAAMSFLAFGLDTNRTALFLQQDVPEVTELAWILSTLTNLGLMERAHAYKAARDAKREINVGTFCYPILMAADILIYDANHVPVGQDQKQHVEMARDIAQRFNDRYGETLVLPEPLIRKEVATVPGIDGRKMSKSYGNTLPLFLAPKKLRKLCMKIVTIHRPAMSTRFSAFSRQWRNKLSLRSVIAPEVWAMGTQNRRSSRVWIDLWKGLVIAMKPLQPNPNLWQNLWRQEPSELAKSRQTPWNGCEMHADWGFCTDFASFYTLLTVF
jgi:tryptophanyl-tRNA synthetase